MINHYNVASESWTQITQAEESGICYLKSGVVQGGVSVKYIDLHYQIDTDGSITEFSK